MRVTSTDSHPHFNSLCPPPPPLAPLVPLPLPPVIGGHAWKARTQAAAAAAAPGSRRAHAHAHATADAVTSALDSGRVIGGGMRGAASRNRVLERSADSGAPPSVDVLADGVDVHDDNVGGMQVHWAVPPGGAPLQGIMVLFHGCTHAGEDWFALPEELRIVNAVLSRGLAAVAFTSTDRSSGCWDTTWPPRTNIDAQLVAHSLSQLGVQLAMAAQGATRGPDGMITMTSFKLGGKLPVYALGASSGGTFASFMPLVTPLVGTAVYISPGHPKVVADAGAVRKAGLQSAVLLYMPRDDRWASAAAVSALSTALVEAGVPRVRTVEAHPQAVTAALLEARLPGLTAGGARAIVQQFQDQGVLTRAGDLTDDPRGFNFVELLSPVREAVPDDTGFLPALVEVLQMCYGQHELTSAHIDTVLDALLLDGRP